MTNWIACCGGTPVERVHEFRYLKWHITGTKGSTSAYVQMSEIKFLDANDNEFNTTGVQGTITNGTIVDGSFANLFDDRVNTKACVSWAKDYIDINIDFGSSNPLDIDTYNVFEWYTANDATERDPSTWTLYGANTSDFSDAVVINGEIGYQATNTRMVLGYTGSLST